MQPQYDKVVIEQLKEINKMLDEINASLKSDIKEIKEVLNG